MPIYEKYMRRCLQLAALGAGNVAPNPMVGAVLVNNDLIIGEGYHMQYGQAHAEVNCINSVASADRHLIPQSTLYVSLEPCSHFGKTPPCADLIIREKIKKVVVGCRDPFKEVNGKGIEKLQQSGVEVVTQILERECSELNRRFFTFHTKHRPYIILKWAQSNDGFIAGENYQNGKRTFISNDTSNRLVHKWRSEEAAILVGTNTALLDDPSLTTRLWMGANPIRLVIDRHLKLPLSLQLLNGAVRTIVFNLIKHEDRGNLMYYQVAGDTDLLHQILNALCQQLLNSVIVEGGAQLLQSFIDEGLWDEARIITNSSLYLNGGLPAPRLATCEVENTLKCRQDAITVCRNLEYKA